MADRIEQEWGEERQLNRFEGSAKCFGFVQTYDEKPRRRLWELMKSQGMQENQQVVFMSDGGENVRRVQEYLHPFSEHLIDWFHITMRLTVLQQQTIRQEAADAVDATGGPSIAADQDEGPQRGFGRPIPPLVSEIQAATTNAGARTYGSLTPTF